ncbi:unnamed protein product (macronuclear) [Paramecium tetraurelia]|uniref:Uncharacterized protein n=1 Tax=Paramecium tetraurelia TaxID=5888 RepID=A0DHD1_PARTE|nr:uncharacterized protein GSPATT00016835001 [Paramecium tetraurelia]CAK82448.1 unnamed protein product [Paramecium tetraurelia]|eukprot:XP_001449845.1 hypothetical protein (macronuclear) [Paramecium tetraurelia strain d4-2]
MSRTQNDDDRPAIPLPQATDQKRQEKLAYDRQMAKITLLKQAEQKNLHLAKLYEMAAENIENGIQVKKELQELADEAKQIKDETMKKRKQQIEQIKKSEQDFIQKRKLAQKLGDSMKQSQVKEYKSTMKMSLSRTRDCILQENQKIREVLYQEEKERKKKKEETKKLEEMKSQQFYKERVSYEKMIEEKLKKTREKLLKDEEDLKVRLKQTQDMLSRSQNKFMELQSWSGQKR